MHTVATVGICTLGCRVNQYESQAIAEELTAHGLIVRPFSEVCDVYIVNTCSVTAESGRKSRQMVRRAHTQNPDAAIFVTGCEAQRAPEALCAIEGVRYLCGNREKSGIVRAVLACLRNESVPSHEALSLQDAPFDSMRITSSTHTRAFVKIEDGCNGKCAYCIIPTLRGGVRSKPMEDVLAEVAGLAANGYREVVLTGIETSAYEYDLAELMAQVAKISGIARIRLGSLNPATLRPAFAEKIARIPQVMPHFHLSVQHGCNSVLHRMRRGYSVEQLQSGVQNLRRLMPQVQFSADIIVGFPGETDAEFEASYQVLQEIGFLHLHLFPYSIRPGTEAATMPNQIPESVKSERLKRLEALDVRSRRASIAPYLTPQAPALPVLFETFADGEAVGHTHHFMEVHVPSDVSLQGQILPVRLTGYTDGGVRGVLESALPKTENGTQKNRNQSKESEE